MILSPSPHPGLRHSRGQCLFAALVVSLLVSGCLSVPVTGSSAERTISVVPGKTTGTIEELVPTARRSGTDVYVSVVAKGDFKVETKKVETTTTKKEKIVTIGFFPGLAACKGGDVVADGAAAFWYNLCMLGAPTLNGLFIAPFRTPGDETVGIGGDGLFSRSALLGYHAHYRPLSNPKTEKRVMDVIVKNADSVSLNDRIGLENDNGFTMWGPGEIRLPNVPMDQKEVGLRIKINPDDSLYEALRPFVESPYPVTIE